MISQTTIMIPTLSMNARKRGVTDRARAISARRRRLVIAQMDAGITEIPAIAARIGVTDRTLRRWLDANTDLRDRVTAAARGRKALDDWQDVPWTRSVPYMGPAGMRIIPGPAHVMVACGTCQRAFQRPTRRRAEQFADLHARLHREDRANRRQEAA